MDKEAPQLSSYLFSGRKLVKFSSSPLPFLSATLRLDEYGGYRRPSVAAPGILSLDYDDCYYNTRREISSMSGFIKDTRLHVATFIAPTGEV